MTFAVGAPLNPNQQATITQQDRTKMKNGINL